ncbi:MAG: hypothetical protein V7K55_19500 [Nostoc sp.]|uniref:hypothetical protein n=1 Tax=Nostoc sp. TaxID=1180 RepID=UPI002FF5395C
MVQQKPQSLDSQSRGWLRNITICFGDFNLPTCRDKAQIVPILLLKVRWSKGKHPLKFPTAAANFSTSFHTATTAAKWHKIDNGIGDWGLGTGD